MPVSIEIVPIPIGSQLTSTIDKSVDPPEPDDKNDFKVRINLDGNGTGLTLSNLSVSDGSIVSVDGSHSVWEATVRPPETAVDALTLTVEADAFSEGNTETTKDIRVSTEFPDDDAELPTELFTHAASTASGIAVTPTRILVASGTANPVNTTVRKYDFSGTEITGERIQSTDFRTGKIDYINGDLLHDGGNASGTVIITGRYNLDDFSEIESYPASQQRTYYAHARLGFIGRDINDQAFFSLPYGTTDAADVVKYDETPSTLRGGWTVQGDIIYMAGDGWAFGYAETIEDTIEFRNYINIGRPTGVTGSPADISIYRDTLYTVRLDTVYSIDIRPYRPMAQNTKTTIYTVFATNGDTIPLKDYCPDAHTLTFGLGFDKPDWLTINASDELEIASDAVTETTPVLVKLTGINYIDSADFEFYLVVEVATAPVWRDVESLTMRAGSSYDLHQIVDADSIAFKSGQTQPTGATLSDGIFTIDTTGGTAYFTATKGTLTTDFQVNIVVVQMPDPDNFSDVFNYRVMIAGIDVSDDLFELPEVTQSLDVILLNEYQVGEVSLTLSSDNTNDYQYNDGVANNFWESNSLNAAGFQEPIEVFVDSDVNGTVIPHLLFSGVILENVADLEQTSVQLTCVDASLSLSNTTVEAFGTLEKWDALRQQSDEATNVGVYIPETSLSPMQTQGASAWSNRTGLTLRDLALPSEGPPINNAGYLTGSAFETSGGFLANRPLLKFLAQHRSETVPFLIDQIALNQSVHNAEVDLPAQTLDDPYVLNRGSVSYSIEDSRVTRRLTDWVYDPTNERVLMILGQPEGHIADILVQYDVERDSYRTLYTFDKDVKAHRIARRTTTDYYILTSSAITQDRSAATLPRTSDSTGYAYDSVAEGSVIDIRHYHADTAVLNVSPAAAGADLQPQLGIHYHVGFENRLYIDEFEGICSEYRGAFKSLGTDVYYRYATDQRFGIARLLNNGSTRQIVSETDFNYHNWLNFGFDMLSNGTVYFVYATGTPTASTLTIKSVISGTEATVFTDTQDLADLTHLDDNGGAYLGCYEALFYDDNLYFFAPIQRVDVDGSDVTRSQVNAAGLVLFSCDVTAGTPTLTVVDKWDFVTHSACNLTVHDGAMFIMWSNR